ncbi:hypothetical protein ANO11243_096310 [Dothideomycetidae sp. 11243]|nr:hypothetical protein ANO11243_096310 [fungal sp. No.11243]
MSSLNDVDEEKVIEHIESAPSTAPTETPWDDPSETRNPANWSIPSKIFHTILPCFLAFTLTLATSTSVPAVPLIKAHFNVNTTTAILPLTLYTLGLAFGPAFIAPLSEVLGRKRVYVASFFCFIAFIAGAGASRTFASLLVCRFLASFLGSAGIAIGAGSITDVWGYGEARSAVALMFILGPFLGPTMGPLCGAYILKDRHDDWRWTQWILILIAAPIFVGLCLMKETSKAWVTRNSTLSAAPLPLSKMIPIALVRPIKMLVTEPIVLSLTLYTSFAYACIFSYFASASYILQFLYHFNLQQVGLSFIAVVIGYILASLLFRVCDRIAIRRTAKTHPDQEPPPERRLYAALPGSVFIPIGLFWYAWEAHAGGHWARLVAAGIPLGLGAFSIFVRTRLPTASCWPYADLSQLSTITYLVDIYKARAAASGTSLFTLLIFSLLLAFVLISSPALAANGTLRYSLGAVFPLFTLQMYHNLGVHWAGSVFAFLSVLLLPIPWLLVAYGPKLRGMNRFID